MEEGIFMRSCFFYFVEGFSLAILLHNILYIGLC